MAVGEASSWNYEDWSELLFQTFFSEENYGEDVLFAISEGSRVRIVGLRQIHDEAQGLAWVERKSQLLASP